MDKKFLPRSDECFVCGVNNPHGLNIEFFVQENEVRAKFKPDINKSGYKGVLHGGVVFAVLDEVMGWSPVFIKKRMGVSAEITIRFIKPVPIGVELIAIGRFTKDKKRIWETEGVLTDKDGNIYSKAYGKYMPLTDEETQKVDDYLIYRKGEKSLFLK